MDRQEAGRLNKYFLDIIEVSKFSSNWTVEELERRASEKMLPYYLPK